MSAVSRDHTERLPIACVTTPMTNTVRIINPKSTASLQIQQHHYNSTTSSVTTSTMNDVISIQRCHYKFNNNIITNSTTMQHLRKQLLSSMFCEEAVQQRCHELGSIHNDNMAHAGNKVRPVCVLGCCVDCQGSRRRCRQVLIAHERHHVRINAAIVFECRESRTAARGQNDAATVGTIPDALLPLQRREVIATTACHGVDTPSVCVIQGRRHQASCAQERPVPKACDATNCKDAVNGTMEQRDGERATKMDKNRERTSEIERSKAVQ